MKTLITILALLSLPVFAANEGPVGVPPNYATVLAEKSMSTGAVAPTYQFTKGLRIYSDGSVKTFIKYMIANPADGEKEVTHLSIQDMVGIRKSIASFKSTPKATDLVDHDSGKPFCVGGGWVSYKVRLPEQTALVEFERSAGCHRYSLKGNEGKDIADYLDELDAYASKKAQAAK